MICAQSTMPPVSQVRCVENCDNVQSIPSRQTMTPSPTQWSDHPALLIARTSGPAVALSRDLGTLAQLTFGHASWPQSSLASSAALPTSPTFKDPDICEPADAGGVLPVLYVASSNLKILHLAPRAPDVYFMMFPSLGFPR